MGFVRDYQNARDGALGADGNHKHAPKGVNLVAHLLFALVLPQDHHALLVDGRGERRKVQREGSALQIFQKLGVVAGHELKLLFADVQAAGENAGALGKLQRPLLPVVGEIGGAAAREALLGGRGEVAYQGGPELSAIDVPVLVVSPDRLGNVAEKADQTLLRLLYARGVFFGFSREPFGAGRLHKGENEKEGQQQGNGNRKNIHRESPMNVSTLLLEEFDHVFEFHSVALVYS